MLKVTFKKPLIFDWDEGNDQKNRIRHNVSIMEAEDIFFDSNRLILDDIKHSSDAEQRFILIGYNKQRRMLFIIFTIRGKKVRIISARDTNRKEETLYEKAISTA